MDPDHLVFDHPSVADIRESDLVERLLADGGWRSRITGLDDIPEEPLIRQRVSLAGVPRNFVGDVGDVDILLCGAGRPDLAVAIEVKRLKFGLSAIRSGIPNKLPELKKGFQQANRLADIGFSQVYLCVFIVVDTREQNLGQHSYSGLSTQLRALVDRSVSPAGLDARVGLYQVEIVQSMDYAPLGVGAWGGCLRQAAKAVTQTKRLTEWVSQAMGLSAPGRCDYVRP